MSRFLTPKFLRYRDARAAGAINLDLPCPQCGYNLRGLSYGRSCPECGGAILVHVARGDVTLAGDEADRGRWRTGFSLAAIAVTVAVVARIGLMFAAVGAGVGGGLLTGGFIGAYHVVGLINACLFIVATWMLTPCDLRENWPAMVWPIRVARFGSLAWLPAYACLLALAFAGGSAGFDEAMWWLSRLFRLLSGGAALVLAGIMHVVALQAEREPAARRFNNVTWLLVWPTLLLGIVPPTITWVAAILVSVVLFPWAWLMVAFALAFHEMSGHLRWAKIHAIESMGRDQRVTEKRAVLQREADGQVRAIPVKDEREIDAEEARW